MLVPVTLGFQWRKSEEVNLQNSSQCKASKIIYCIIRTNTQHC